MSKFFSFLKAIGIGNYTFFLRFLVSDTVNLPLLLVYFFKLVKESAMSFTFNNCAKILAFLLIQVFYKFIWKSLFFNSEKSAYVSFRLIFQLLSLSCLQVKAYSIFRKKLIKLFIIYVYPIFKF